MTTITEADVVVAFETCVLYLDKRFGLAVGESLDLAAQRDALLPRLVSGELGV